MLSVLHGDSVASLVAAWVIRRWLEPALGDGVTVVVGTIDEVSWTNADPTDGAVAARVARPLAPPPGHRHIVGAGEVRRGHIHASDVEAYGGVQIDPGGAVLLELGDDPTSAAYSSVLVDPKRSVVRLAVDLARSLGGSYTPEWFAKASFDAMASRPRSAHPPLPLLVRAVEDFDRTGFLTSCRLRETGGIIATLANGGIPREGRTLAMLDEIAETIEDETTRAEWMRRHDGARAQT